MKMCFHAWKVEKGAAAECAAAPPSVSISSLPLLVISLQTSSSLRNFYQLLQFCETSGTLFRFEVCLGALSVRRSPPLFHISFFKDALVFASKTCWTLIGSIPPCMSLIGWTVNPKPYVSTLMIDSWTDVLSPDLSAGL